jgi:hypothetical protein
LRHKPFQLPRCWPFSQFTARWLSLVHFSTFPPSGHSAMLPLSLLCFSILCLSSFLRHFCCFWLKPLCYPDKNESLLSELSCFNFHLSLCRSTAFPVLSSLSLCPPSVYNESTHLFIKSLHKCCLCPTHRGHRKRKLATVSSQVLHSHLALLAFHSLVCFENSLPTCS